MTQQFTFQEYQGWENKFTWAMALHLSNEQYLYNWAIGIVERYETDTTAGQCLHQWVVNMIDNWIPFSETHEAELLVSQLTGDAIAFAEWGDVVKRLAGMEQQVLEQDNPFTDGIVVYFMQHPTERQKLLEVFQAVAERKQLLNEHPEWVDDMNTGRPQHEVIVDKILDAFSGHSPFWTGVDAVKEHMEELNQNWIENRQRRHDGAYTAFARMLLARAMEAIVWKHVAESFREEEL